MKQQFPEFFSSKKDDLSADITKEIERYSKGYQRLNEAIGTISGGKLNWKPNPKKWSIREIALHLVDSEIIGIARMNLVIATSESNPPALLAYDQDQLSILAAYHSMDEMLALQTFRDLRKHQTALLKNLPKEVFEKFGIHSEVGKLTLLDLVKRYASHVETHIKQIEGLKQLMKGEET
ncbi:MAG: DinB family protein [Chloroherpetonaceae bacterium]|nr:DinB family protein [Chloroherpetonaceae bacterium]